MLFPQGKEQLVLNGILHPDSTIKISLTKTLPSGSSGSDFPVVDNAEIRLYEDDILIGRPVFQDSVYMLKYYPQASKNYRVEVEAPGFPIVKASDRMPQAVEARTCLEPSDRYTLDFLFYSAILHIYIDDPAGIVNNYWLSTQWINHHYDNCEEVDGQIILPENCEVVHAGWIHRTYHSFSSVPDRFNTYIDVLSGGITVYDFIIRVEDISYEGQEIYFDIASSIPEGRTDNEVVDSFIYLQVMNASQHYDRYLKSSITYALRSDLYADEEILFKPFSEIVQSYSNVENGTGIFAAYNTTSVKIGNLCDE